MTRRAALLLAIVALPGLLLSCSGDDGAAPPPPSSTTAAPAATTTTTPPATDAAWSSAGHDLDNSRAAAGAAVRRDNVADLRVAWEIPLEGGLSTVPIIDNGAVYAQTGNGRIVAADLESGDVRWQTEPYGFSIGPYGVAVADGRVIGLHGSAGVVAVSAETGEELWIRDIIPNTSTGIDIQPVVVNGLVLVSTVPVSIGGIYTPGDHGVIHALDASTGDVRWTFDTVDSEDLWGNPEVNSGGGAWYPPAIDTERGLAYWGVANPAPFPGTSEFPNGSSRPGPNLYTDSVVALDLATGQLRWYHQVHPHDLFDRDLVHTMLLRDPAGDVVIGTGKGGVVVGLDPDTGELRWQTPVGVHDNDDLTALDGPTTVTPGTYGGVITPPAHRDGVVYTASLHAPVELKPDETAYFGAELGQFDGDISAIDAHTGALLWSTKVPGDPLGAMTVVNDLLFTALFDGTVLALDRESGTIVWQTTAPGRINGWMAVAGDTIVVPVGIADPPRLVAYRLG
jgi:outer membrane protein assembly factor BamB